MIKKIFGDITKIEADVIVNAANTQLIHGGGVARVIAKAAGSQLVEESKKVKYCPIGELAVTSAGNLKAKKVFHIPTICYKSHQSATIEDIKSAFKKALQIAKKQGFKSLATPLLGAGVVGLGEDEVEKALREVAAEFPKPEVMIIKWK